MEKKKRSKAVGFLEEVIWCFSLRARAHPQPGDVEHRIDHYVGRNSRENSISFYIKRKVI